VGSRVAVVFALLALGCTESAPPRPEVVVSVDTDLPVPLAVSSLRVDLYDENGAWFESADFARPDPRDWPVSFGVWADAAPRRVSVRLRAYPTGQERDYRGEAPHLWGGPMDPAPSENAPRLVEGGADVTPPSAPWALVTVDRLVAIDLAPDAKKEARVTLTGACLGTSAILEKDAQSCVATEKTLEPVAALALGDARDTSPTRAGTWSAEPCDAQPDGAPRVCVAGGATVLGTPDLLSGVEEPALPARTFGLHRYFVDRFEVTVGRFRDALGGGLSPSVMPVANDGPLGTSGNGVCTWSRAPQGREDYALNCVSWATARAFCKFLGGDLPSEAQWEHAATIAGRAKKTRYPWGDDEPSCDQAAFGRADSPTDPGKCLDRPATPPAPAESRNDVTPLGILGLGGGLSEWVIDKAAPYADACFVEGPLVDPRCEPAASDASSTIRGANYILPQMVASTVRFVDARTTRTYPLGFRCAYTEDGP